MNILIEHLERENETFFTTHEYWKKVGTKFLSGQWWSLFEPLFWFTCRISQESIDSTFALKSDENPHKSMEYTDIDDDSIFADFKMPDISVSNWWQKLITSEKNVQANELKDHVDLWCKNSKW